MSDMVTRPFTKAEMDAMRTVAQDQAQDEVKVTRQFWAKLKRVGSQIPFAEDLVAAFYCAMDPATPRRVKLILLGAIAYFIMPMDAIPDILPLFGFADDAAVLATAITQVAGSITEEHRERARKTLAG